MKNCRYKVEGKVQGVFFRKSTYEYVRKHIPNIKGYVKNLRDGSVEVLASGEDAEIENLEAFLREGPETASVTNVTIVEQPPFVNFSDFTIV